MIDEFASTVEEWQRLGVPYVHRGLRRTGCDCTGLIIGALKELGFLRKYKLRVYPHDWNLHAGAGDYIRQELAWAADPVRDPPRRGDIVLFRFGRCIAHAGVIVKPGVFCHCHRAAGRVRRGLLRTPKWRTRLVEVWRLNERKVLTL